MATIYRFIVEQKTLQDSGGRKGSGSTGNRATKGASKKGKHVSLFGGEKGGVEHNRKMRAINPLINRMTGGAWEKGMRVSRAGIGLIKSAQQDGLKGVLSGPALYIIVAFLLTMGMKLLEFYQNKAKEQNTQNFKQLENGVGSINSQYKVSTNFWTGRHTYNQNK